MDGRADLLRMLVDNGLLSSAQSDQARTFAVTDGCTPFAAAIELGLLDEHAAYKVVAAELGWILVDPLDPPPTPEALSATPAALLNDYDCIPLKLENNELWIAFTEPVEMSQEDDICFVTGRAVRMVLAPLSRLHEAKNQVGLLTGSGKVEVVERERDREAEAAATAARTGKVYELSGRLGAGEGPAVALSNVIVRDAIKTGASDIHLEPQSNGALVRCRIDGILRTVLKVPPSTVSALTSRFKVMAGMNITERRVPQDARISVSVDRRVVDVRVSTLPTNYGEKVVMRILDASLLPSSLDEMGLAGVDAARLKLMLAQPQGVAIITGPTGSGKTTTLYACLSHIKDDATNVVTIEEPVEYRLAGVNQVNVNEKVGLKFATALRSILRQDPDVVMVGEIRDAETAEVAFQASQTGHLILSTLHTNDAPSAVTRLMDLGVSPEVLAPELLAIIAQRLVRRLCPECRQLRPILDAEAALLASLGVEPPASVGAQVGCKACFKTGYRGRRPVVEILWGSPAMRQGISDGAGVLQLRELARQEGMRSMREAAAELIVTGETTPEEVERVVGSLVAEQPHVSDGSHESSGTLGHVPVYDPAAAPALGGSAESGKREADFGDIPVIPATGTEAEALLNATRPAEKKRREKPLILVVDDVDSIRRLLVVVHQKAGFDVIEAATGAQAVKQSLEQVPDLIVLDLMLPDMNGIEVCQRLRALHETASIPILMLTSMSAEESELAGLEAGVDDYQVKPISPARLVARVRRLLSRRSPMARHHAAPPA